MVSGVTPPGVAFPASLDFTDDDIRGLETVASRAWPPAERTALDGWMLRASDAPTRRTNSVLAQGDKGGMALDVRIEAAEDFYHRRHVPPRFQLTRASQPGDLDDVLAARGYVVEAPVDVQIAAPVAMAASVPRPEIDLRSTVDPSWLEVYAGGFNRDVIDVLNRIEGQKGFLNFWLDGNLVAVSLGVIEGGWLGVFGMQTRPAYRNRGIGRAMLEGLAAWALAENAVGVYLQVEQDNPGARRLYERHGFRTVYAYHYRTLFSDDRHPS